jgi:hypothetical protein
VVAGGGVDWQTVRPDGVIEIDAHYALLTHEGDPIEVRSRGIRKIADRVARGEPVRADEYYFRTHVRLSATATRLSWLNDMIAVSAGERERKTVRIHIHEVL